MRILVVEPHKQPFEVEIENNLKSMQNIVGGYIEFYGISHDMTIVCNEEGKLLGLEGNRRVGNEIIAGTFFIVGQNEDLDSISLTDEQIKSCKARFQNPEEIDDSEVEQSISIKFVSMDNFEDDEYEI